MNKSRYRRCFTSKGIFVFQGFLFSTNECIENTSDILRLWLHETSRVYGDKLTEEKDIDAFLKVQVDLCKKNFEVSDIFR